MDGTNSWYWYRYNAAVRVSKGAGGVLLYIIWYCMYVCPMNARALDYGLYQFRATGSNGANKKIV